MYCWTGSLLLHFKSATDDTVQKAFTQQAAVYATAVLDDTIDGFDDVQVAIVRNHPQVSLKQRERNWIQQLVLEQHNLKFLSPKLLLSVSQTRTIGTFVCVDFFFDPSS